MRGKRLNRLLQIIAALRGPTSYNAKRLAERYGCSRRNIYRDIAVLELAGVPVFHDPDYGDGGGYRIRSDWWFPSVSLTDRECLDLALLTRIAESQSIPLLDEAGGARDKLLGTLPPKQQDLIRTASELFDAIGLNLADHSHCRHFMTTIQTALLTQRKIECAYRSPHQSRIKKLVLQPRQVFLAAQAWYLLAWDDKAKDNRIYRVARFTEIKLTTKPIKHNEPCSIREVLGNAWSVYRGERDYHVEVLFHPPAAEQVSETKWHHTQRIEKLKDGCVVFRATVSGLEEVTYWVLGWGPLAEVKKPVELRSRVCDDLKKMLHRYQ
ncbi:MAG: helix-turn-helix transcriptional regulator [Phycisphaeraceae bacterium]